jgi:hypothetical protein
MQPAPHNCQRGMLTTCCAQPLSTTAVHILILQRPTEACEQPAVKKHPWLGPTKRTISKKNRACFSTNHVAQKQHLSVSRIITMYIAGLLLPDGVDKACMLICVSIVGVYWHFHHSNRNATWQPYGSRTDRRKNVYSCAYRHTRTYSMAIRTRFVKALSMAATHELHTSFHGHVYLQQRPVCSHCNTPAVSCYHTQRHHIFRSQNQSCQSLGRHKCGRSCWVLASQHRLSSTSSEGPHN